MVDKRGVLEEENFSYQLTKKGTVRLFWQGKEVVILSGKKATDFARKISGLQGKEAQLLMAKATGNFKRGNERPKRFL